MPPPVSSPDTSWFTISASVACGAFVGVLAALWYHRRSKAKMLLSVGKRRKTKKDSSRQNAASLKGGKEPAKKMRLYHTRTYRSARVTWLIAELGVEADFDVVQHDPYSANEDDRELYRQMVHPHGTVPALVLLDDKSPSDIGGTKVAIESGSICLYLADYYGELLPPTNAVIDYYDWAVYVVTTVDSSLTVIENALARNLNDEQLKSDTSVEKAFTILDIFARRLNKHLTDRLYICGSEFTVADIVVGYSVMWTSVIKGGRIIFDYDNVKAYLNRLKARPAFQEAIGTPREWINASP